MGRAMVLNRPIYLWPQTIHRFPGAPANLAWLVERLGLTFVPASVLADFLKYLGRFLGEFEDAGSKVKGLAKLFAKLKITKHLGAAEAFCEQLGANDVADLKRHTQHGANNTYAKELATKLNLPTILADKFFEAIDALPARE